MAFLIVAGITVPVAPTSAVKKGPDRSGGDSRAFSGALRSTTRWRKRSWQFTTSLLTDSAAAAIEAFDNTFVTCSGDALGGSVTCQVVINDGPYTKVSSAGGGFKRALALVLREV